MIGNPILTIEDLCISYGKGSHRVEAVRNLSLSVNRGEFVAIVGESGSGKSTMAASLIGLLPKNADIHSGSLKLNGMSLRGLDEIHWNRLRGKEIGFVPQEPALSLDPVKRIGTQVIEALTLHGMRGSDASERALDILRLVGLHDVKNLMLRYPHELSGGMCQRILIAMGLANNPPLLIADEPTSALDVSVQRRILDHLQELVQLKGTAVVLITHDLGIAMDRADRVFVMRDGQIVEHGNAHAIFDNPKHPYTKQLIAAAPSFKPAPRLCHTQPSQVENPREPLVRVTGLTKIFHHGSKENAAVDHVSFEVLSKSTVSIVGESGSGKSTTARMILGLENASAGDIQFQSNSVAAFTTAQLRHYRRDVQVVYQNPYSSLDPRFNVEQIIGEPLNAFSIGDTKSRRARTLQLLNLVGLPESFISRRPGELSGGQRQRVAIARALALEPKLIVLDEPLSALDVSVQKQIVELLQVLQKELGLSYLFISHDLAIVRQISDYVVVMQKGRVVEQGTASSLFESPKHPYTQGLLNDVPGRLFIHSHHDAINVTA